MAFQSSRLDGLDASARRRMLGGNSFNSFHSSAPPTPVANDRHSDDDSSTATDLSYTISTIDTTEEGIPVAVVKNKPQAAPPVTETSYVTPPRQTKIGGTTAGKTPGTVPMTRTPQSASSHSPVQSGRGETPDADGDDDEISPTSTMTPPVLSSSPAKLPKMPGMPDSVSASRRGTAVASNSNKKNKSLFDEVMSRSSAGSIDADDDDDGDESDNDAIDQPAQSPLQEQEQEPPVQEGSSSPKKKDKTKKTKPTSRLERYKLKAIKAASKELGMDSKMLAKAAGVDHTKVENAPDNRVGTKKDDNTTVDVDFLSSALGLPASFFAATDSSPQRKGVSAAREPSQAEEDPISSSTRTIESNNQTMYKESAVVESSSAELTRPQIGSLGDALGMKIDTTSNAVPIREGSSAPTTSKSSASPTAASAAAVDMIIQPKDGSLANALGLKIDPNPTSSYIRVENQAPPPIMPYNGDSSALKYSTTTMAVPARGSLADALQMMIDPNADESAYIRKRGESPPPIMPYNEKSSALGYSSSKAEPATSTTTAPTRGSLADALQMSIDSSSQAPYIRKEGEEAGPPIMPYNEKSSALKYSTAATSEETTKAPARGSLADALQMTVDSSSQAPYIRKDGEAAPPIMPYNANSSALKYSTGAATFEETTAPTRGSLADALQMTVDSSKQAPYIRKEGEAAPPIMPRNENSSALKYSTATRGTTGGKSLAEMVFARMSTGDDDVTTTTSTSTGSGDDDDQGSETYGTLSQEPQPTQEQPRPGSLAMALGLSIDADQNAPPIRAENQAPPPPQRHEGTTFMGYAQDKSSSSGGGGKKSLSQMVLAKVNLSDYDEEDSSDDDENDESEESYDNDLKPQAQQQQQQPKQVSGRSFTEMVLSNLNLSNDIEESSDEDESDSDSDSEHYAQPRNLTQQAPTTFKRVTRENMPLPKKSMTQMVLSRLPTSFTDDSQYSGSSTYDQDESDDDSQDDFALVRNANTSEDKAIEVDTAASTSDESDTDESEDYFRSFQTASAGPSSLANALGLQVRPSPEVPQIRGNEDSRKLAPAPVLSSRPQKPSLEQMVLSQMSFDDDTATATTDESYLNESVNDFQSTLGTTSIKNSSTSQVPAKVSQGPAKAPRSLAQLVLSRVSIDDVTVTSTSVGSSESDESEDDYNIIQKKAAPGPTASTKQKQDALYEPLEISSSDDDSSDEYENEPAESKGRDLPQPGSLASALNMRIDPSTSSAPIRQPGQTAPVVQQNDGTTFKGVQNTPFMSPDAQKSFADFVLSRVSYNLDENDVSSYDDGSSEEVSSVGGNADNVDKVRPSEVKPVQSQPVRRSSAPRSFAAMILSRVTVSMSDELSYESSEEELSVDEASVDGVSAEDGKGVKNESKYMSPSATSQTPQKGSLAAALGMNVDPSAEAAFVRKEGERPPPVPVHNENSSALGYLTSNTNARKASNAPRPNSLAAALGMAIDPSAEAAYIRKEGESAPPVPEYNKNSSALGYLATSEGTSKFSTSPRPNSLAAALGMAIDPSAEAAYIRKAGDSAPPLPEYNKNSSALGYLATSKVASKFSTSPRPNSLAAALGMSIDPSSEAAYIRKEGESAPPVPVYNQNSSALGYLATSEAPKPSTSPRPNSLAAALGMSIDPSSEAAYIRKEGDRAPPVPVFNKNSSALGYLATSEAPKPSTSPRPNSLAAALGMSIDPSSEAAYIRKEGDRAPPVPVFNKNSSALGYLATREISSTREAASKAMPPRPNSLAAALGMSIDPNPEASYIREEGESAPPIPIHNENSSALAYLPRKPMPPRPNSLAAALGMSIDPNPEASYIREEGESAPPIPSHNENSSALAYLPKKPVPPRPNSLAAALGMTIDPSAEAAYIREEGETPPPIPVHNENSSALGYLPRKPVPPRPNSLAAALGMTIDPSAEAAYIREEGETPPPVPVHNENSSALGYLSRKPVPPRPNSLAAALGMTIDPSAEAAYIREEGETPPPVPVRNENSSALGYLTTKQESLAEHEKNGAKTTSPSIRVSGEVASKSTTQTESEVAPLPVPAMPNRLAAALGMAVAPNHQDSPVRTQGETPDEKDSDDESAPQVKNVDESDSYSESESDTEYDVEETEINSVEENDIKERGSVPQVTNIGSSLEAALGAPLDMDTAVAAIKQARSMSKSKKSLFDAAIVRMGLGDLGVPDNETPVEVPTPAEAIAAAEVPQTSNSAKTFNTKDSMLAAVLNIPARETMSAVESDEKDLVPELNTPARETTSVVESDQKGLAPEEETEPVQSQDLVRDAEKNASASGKEPDRVATEPEAPQSEVDQRAEDQKGVMQTPSTDSDQKAEDQNGVPVMPTPSTDSDINRGVEKQDSSSKKTKSGKPQYKSRLERIKAKALRVANKGIESDASFAVADGTESSSIAKPEQKPQNVSAVEPFAAADIASALGIPPSLLAPKKSKQEQPSVLKKTSQAETSADQKILDQSLRSTWSAAAGVSQRSTPVDSSGPDSSRAPKPVTGNSKGGKPQYKSRKERVMAKLALKASQGMPVMPSTIPQMPDAPIQQQGNETSENPPKMSRLDRMKANAIKAASKDLGIDTGAFSEALGIKQQTPPASDAKPSVGKNLMEANEADIAGALGISPSIFGAGSKKKSVISNPVPPTENAVGSEDGNVGLDVNDVAAALGMPVSLLEGGGEPKRSKKSTKAKTAQKKIDLREEAEAEEGDGFYYSGGTPSLGSALEPVEPEENVDLLECMLPLDAVMKMRKTTSTGNLFALVAEDEKAAAAEDEKAAAVVTPEKETRQPKHDSAPKETSVVADAHIPKSKSRSASEDNVIQLAADAPISKARSRSAPEDDAVMREGTPSTAATTERKGMTASAGPPQKPEANAKVTTMTASREVPPPANTPATKAESGIQPETNNAVPTQPQPMVNARRQMPPMNVNMEKVKAGMKYLEGQILDAKGYVSKVAQDMETLESRITKLESKPKDNGAASFKAELDAHTKRIEEKLSKTSSQFNDKLSVLETKVSNNELQIEEKAKHIKTLESKIKAEKDERLVASKQWEETGSKLEKACDEVQQSRTLLQQEYEDVKSVKLSFKNHQSMVSKRLDDLQQQRDSVSKRLVHLHDSFDAIGNSTQGEGEGRKTSDVLRSIQHNLQKEGERRKSLTARLKSRAGVPVTASESKLMAAEPAAKEKGIFEAEERKEKTTEPSLSRALEVEPIVEGKTIVDASLEKDREDEKAAEASLQKALEDERIVKEAEEAARPKSNEHEHVAQGKTAKEDRVQKERVEEGARLKALEDERITKEKAAEEERIAQEKAAAEAAMLKSIEAERIAKEKAAEEERIAQEKVAAEAARLQSIEDERVAKEKAAEAARLEEERIAKEEELRRQKEEEEIRIAAEKAEAERIAKEQAAAAEAARLEEEERIEQERIAAEQAAEAAGLKALEDERIAAEKAETERLEHERIAAEQAAEAARLEEERIAAEKAAEAERLEQERIAAEAARLEEDRIAAEKAAEAKRLEQERIAAEEAAEVARLEQERIANEEAAAEAQRLEEERIAKEAAAEAERIAIEKAEEEARQMALQWSMMESAKLKALEDERVAEEKAEEARLKAYEEELLAQETAESERLKALEEERLAKLKADEEAAASQSLQVPEEDGKVVVQEKSLESVDVLTEGDVTAEADVEDETVTVKATKKSSSWVMMLIIPWLLFFGSLYLASIVQEPIATVVPQTEDVSVPSAVSGIAPSPARHQIIRSALRRSTAMRKKQTIASEIYLYPRTSNASVPSLSQGGFVDEGTESLGASKSSSATGALLGMDVSSNVPVSSPFVGFAASGKNRRRPAPSSYEAPHVFYNMSETRETIIGALANRAKSLRSGGKVGRERMRNWLGKAVKSSSDVVKKVVDEEFVWI